MFCGNAREVGKGEIRLRASVLSVLAIGIVISSAGSPSTLALTFPQDFGFSSTTEWLIDSGRLWESNRMFHPFDIRNEIVLDSLDVGSAFYWTAERLIRYQHNLKQLANDAGEGLWVSGRLGGIASAQAGPDRVLSSLGWGPFLWCQAGFRHNWYAQLLVRATNEPASLPHYTGVRRDISRFGLNTGETDQSHIGYGNDWLIADFGRGREIWGPNVEDNLTLAGTAPSYERLLLEGRYKRFTYRYFYGFLETTGDTVNVERYIVGRALEYRNSRNLVLGVSEVSILAGLNRSVDWASLNPLAVHLEIEQNDRSNYQKNSEDVDYSFYVDWLPIHNLRIAASLDIDDFQMDATDRRKYEDMIGYLAHIAWTPLGRSVGLTLFADDVYISTYSMQHQNPHSNLVSRGQLLGHPIGNDATRTQVGIRTILPIKQTVEVRIGQQQWGDNSLLIRPYQAYDSPIKTSFPSGETRTNRYLEMSVGGYYGERFRYTLDGHIDLLTRGQRSRSEHWILTLEYFLPFEYIGR